MCTMRREVAAALLGGGVGEEKQQNQARFQHLDKLPCES